MRPICSVEVVRRAEAGAGVPEPVLMQRASTALAGVCLDLVRGGRGRVRGARVAALVGSGNNGGDALWALAHLARRGIATAAIGDPERMHVDGAGAARAAGTRILAWDDPQVAAVIAAADLVLDGILGIGGAGAIREPAAGAVGAVLASGVPVVAVDVPSGVDSDTGQVAGLAMQADVTVCFGVLKRALVVPPARSLAGSVTVVDIGLRARDLEPAAWALSLADLGVAGPAPDAHKYSRGVVGVTAGSRSYPGAALLAVGGARMSGVGMVAFSPGPETAHSGPEHRAPRGRTAGTPRGRARSGRGDGGGPVPRRRPGPRQGCRCPLHRPRAGLGAGRHGFRPECDVGPRTPGGRRLCAGGACPAGRPAGARRPFRGGVGHRPDPARGGVRADRVRRLRRPVRGSESRGAGVRCGHRPEGSRDCRRGPGGDLCGHLR